MISNYQPALDNRITQLIIKINKDLCAGEMLDDKVVTNGFKDSINTLKKLLTKLTDDNVGQLIIFMDSNPLDPCENNTKSLESLLLNLLIPIRKNNQSGVLALYKQLWQVCKITFKPDIIQSLTDKLNDKLIHEEALKTYIKIKTQNYIRGDTYPRILDSFEEIFFLNISSEKKLRIRNLISPTYKAEAGKNKNKRVLPRGRKEQNHTRSRPRIEEKTNSSTPQTSQPTIVYASFPRENATTFIKDILAKRDEQATKEGPSITVTSTTSSPMALLWVDSIILPPVPITPFDLFRSRSWACSVISPQTVYADPTYPTRLSLLNVPTDTENKSYEVASQPNPNGFFSSNPMQTPSKSSFISPSIRRV